MLTSKIRSHLRSAANKLDCIIYIGKGDINDNIIKQTEDALVARELIKCKMLNNSSYEIRKLANKLASATNSDIVQIIGNKFILYRKNNDKNILKLKTV